MGTRSAAPAKGAEPEWFTSATPWIAALAVLCASTALSGVIEGDLWLVRIGVVIIAITVTGAFLRATRLTPPLVAIAQVFVLLCLLTALHTRSGIFLFIPGPEALGELGDVLAESVAQVQTGVPPVHASPAIQALVVLAIGLVAVLVDTLAVAAAAPAASGLVLLCVFAVPASLADEMLPFWTFILGAAAFAMLLAVDGQHRHEAWRGRLGSGSASGSGSSATSVASIAMVIALVVGAGFTFVGTVGRLPGGSGGGGGKGGIGLSEMTSLRGMLNRGRAAEVFYVEGLSESYYMRATTLARYVPNKGWERGLNPDGNPARGELPPQPGDRGEGKTTTIKIEPRDWKSYWLPTYGAVRSINTPDDDYRFDPKKGSIFTTREREPEPYEIGTVLSTPTKQALRLAPPGGKNVIEPEYFKFDGVEQPVIDAANKAVEGATNDFDKAAKLSEFFNSPTSGFKYDLKTQGDVTKDALTDFVTRSKVGYCEQYASAMAVMARVVGLASRVAIGFTAGVVVDNKYRMISTEDAHAWVEIFFPNYGWMTFDPTPVDDGRGVVPPYMRETQGPNDELPTGETNSESVAPSATGSAPTSAATDGTEDNQSLQEAGPTGPPTWLLWAIGAALALAVLVTLFLVLALLGVVGAGLMGATWARKLLIPAAAGLWLMTAGLAAALISWWLAVPLVIAGLVLTPLLVRTVRRRNRLHEVAKLGPGAASAAWSELMAESIDRGAPVPVAETIRTAARRLAREHNLDDAGKDGLRLVIGTIERSWYSANPVADPALPGALAAVRQSLRQNAPLSWRARLFPKSVLKPTPAPVAETPEREPVPV
ncbi:transglutaminaseTgpA domain-containing protein [Lentzea sp. BCCO 10_0856]|uniref:TransglutaminaseTgpA domain-containing protein n=1 Tax=Lentzea miocenica TaxID=3095431 RepID=A0ABU4T674_9PSEU|nr:transglutaminaseTgpA domain-containing protein [Lentzea sp. BCCO 10_0856]MDX8033664.1 transglutaminaseTgpA domain-containing protein [Lentzea sp. BCCO 10_0856]